MTPDDDDLILKVAPHSIEASFQLIIKLTASVAILQHDMDRMGVEIGKLRDDASLQERERARDMLARAEEIQKLQNAIATLNGFTQEEKKAIRRRLDTDADLEQRQRGLRWPLLIGLIIAVATITTNAIVAVVIHLLSA